MGKREKKVKERGRRKNAVRLEEKNSKRVEKQKK